MIVAGVINRTTKLIPDTIARITDCSVSAVKRAITRSRTINTPVPTRPSKYNIKFDIAVSIIKQLIIDYPHIHNQQIQSKLIDHHQITLSINTFIKYKHT